MNVLSHVLAQTVQTNAGDDRGWLMSILIWLFVGLVAGFLGSKIVNKRGEGVFMDIILGLIGSFVGGFIVRLFGLQTGPSIIISIIVATIGAIIVLLIYHRLIRGSATSGRGPVV